MKPTLIFSLCILGSLFAANPAMAASYKWTDEKGNIHYSQHPPAEGSYERMKVDKSPPSAADTAVEAPTQPSADAGKSATGNKVVKEELAKSQELRAKNCEAAKKNLEVLTVYKRFKDKDGNVVRMDDNVREQKIEEAKQHISEFCE